VKKIRNLTFSLHIFVEIARLCFFIVLFFSFSCVFKSSLIYIYSALHNTDYLKSASQ